MFVLPSRYIVEMDLNTQKTLYIGSKLNINVLFNKYQCERIILVLENIHANETYFYCLNVSEVWKIEPKIIHQSKIIVTIYGFKMNEPEVTVSNAAIIPFPQTGVFNSNMEMKLTTHKQHSSFPSAMDLSVEKMDMDVEQRVDKISFEPSIVFTCKTNLLPTRFEFKYHYIHIVQTTCTVKNTAIYKEYIDLVTTYNNEVPCVKLPSREAVTATIYKVFPQDINCYKVIKISRPSRFVTHNTKEDVRCLYRMAASFILGSESMPVRYLFRNKPLHHPTIQETNQTGIMKKYDKDDNGDQASSINHQIKGLFFSASVDKDTLQPPHSSFFGNYRILIKPTDLLPNLNIYFADFYCNYKAHYATLVVTRPGSTEDMYCQPRLVKLDVSDNPFLFESIYDPWSCRYYTTRNRNLWVEVLYTENVPVAAMRREGTLIETYTQTSGRGQSRPNGIPKNKYCSTCNLPKRPYLTSLVSTLQLLAI